MRGLPGYVMVLRHIIWRADFLTRGEMMGRRCPALWRAKQGHDFLLHGTRYLDLYRLQVQLKFLLVRFKKRNSDTNYAVCLGATVTVTQVAQWPTCIVLEPWERLKVPCVQRHHNAQFLCVLRVETGSRQAVVPRRPGWKPSRALEGLHLQGPDVGISTVLRTLKADSGVGLILSAYLHGAPLADVVAQSQAPSLNIPQAPPLICSELVFVSLNHPRALSPSPQWNPTSVRLPNCSRIKHDCIHGLAPSGRPRKR